MREKRRQCGKWIVDTKKATRRWPFPNGWRHLNSIFKFLILKLFIVRVIFLGKYLGNYQICDVLQINHWCLALGKLLHSHLDE